MLFVRRDCLGLVNAIYFTFLDRGPSESFTCVVALSPSIVNVNKDYRRFVSFYVLCSILCVLNVNKDGAADHLSPVLVFGIDAPVTD